MPPSILSMLALFHYQVQTTRSQHALLPTSQTSQAQQQCTLAMLSLLCMLSLLQLLSLLVCPSHIRYINLLMYERCLRRWHTLQFKLLAGLATDLSVVCRPWGPDTCHCFASFCLCCGHIQQQPDNKLSVLLKSLHIAATITPDS